MKLSLFRYIVYSPCRSLLNGFVIQVLVLLIDLRSHEHDRCASCQMPAVSVTAHCVHYCVHGVPVSHVKLDTPGILPFVRQLVLAGVSEYGEREAPQAPDRGEAMKPTVLGHIRVKSPDTTCARVEGLKSKPVFEEAALDEVAGCLPVEGGAKSADRIDAAIRRGLRKKWRNHV